MRRNLYNSRIEVAEADTMPGDLLCYGYGPYNNELKKRTFFIKNKDLKYIFHHFDDKNTGVIGIVLIPASHNVYGDNTAGVVSIHCMDSNNPDLRIPNTTTIAMNLYMADSQCDDLNTAVSVMNTKAIYPIGTGIIGTDDYTGNQWGKKTMSTSTTCEIPKIITANADTTRTNYLPENNTVSIISTAVFGGGSGYDDITTYVNGQWLTRYKRNPYAGYLITKPNNYIAMCPFNVLFSSNTYFKLGKGVNLHFSTGGANQYTSVYWGNNVLCDFAGNSYQKLMVDTNTATNYKYFPMADVISKYICLQSIGTKLSWHVPTLGELVYWESIKDYAILEAVDIIDELCPNANESLFFKFSSFATYALSICATAYKNSTPIFYITYNNQLSISTNTSIRYYTFAITNKYKDIN